MLSLNVLVALVGLIIPLFCFLCPSCVEYYQLVGYYMWTIKNDTEWAYTYKQPTNWHNFIPQSNNCSVFGTFDYIVVGGGATGAVVASRLSENSSLTVLLLEAGGTETDFSNIPAYSGYNLKLQVTWSYNTTSQNTSCQGMYNKQCVLYKGKGLGGNSLISNLRYERGNKRDYDNWSNQGNPSWSYKKVLPYFKKSEHSEINGDLGYHGTQGPLNVEYPKSSSYSPEYQAFIAANNELGVPTVDYNGANQLGVAPTQFMTINGVKQTTAKVFLQSILSRKNLNVTTESYVVKILINRGTRAAYGVQFSNQGLCFIAKANKEVIISAGGYGSPQLLMQSGIGPESDLAALGIPVIQNLSVGRNLQTSSVYIQLNFNTNYTFPNEGLQSKVEDYLNGSGLLTVPGNQQAVGFYQTNMTNITGVPDIQLILVPSRNTVGNSLRKILTGYTEETYNSVWANVDQRRSFFITVQLLRSKSRGYVKLASNNPYDYPLINTRALSDSKDADIETLYQGILFAIKLVNNTTAFKKLNATLLNTTPSACQGKEYLSKDYWYCCLRQLTLPVFAAGTCRMGLNPLKEAVVNDKLRVHGVSNLRVADTSIFPENLSCGDLTTSAIMVGELVSDMIKSQQ